MTACDLRASLHACSPGDLVLRRHYPEPGATPYLTVLQSDPHILVSDEFLHCTEHDHAAMLGIRLEPPPGAPPPVPCWHNWLLHIDAANQHLVYRITTYDLEHHAWRASWPD